MRRLVAGVLAVTALSAWAGPASAAPPSPRPTAELLGTGTISTEGGEEAYLEVVAQDPDGIITEIEVQWGDGSISFAHRYPCLFPPLPAPGEPHRFLVSHPYQEAGTYAVRYVVHSSTTDCQGDPGIEQHSRPYVTRLMAP